MHVPWKNAENALNH